MNAILEQVYPQRIEAIEALRAVNNSSSSTQLRDCAGHICQSAERFGRASSAVNWRAFGKALDIAALLVDWRKSRSRGGTGRERFRRAAKLQFEELVSEKRTLSVYM